jgi:hypothetical protein
MCNDLESRAVDAPLGAIRFTELFRFVRFIRASECGFVT